MQARAARVGFDWARLADVIAKVDEEVAETKEAVSRRRRVRIKEEIGDLLFSIVNLARFQNINAEECMDPRSAGLSGGFSALRSGSGKQGDR